MKKWIRCVITLLLIFTLAGCASKKNEESSGVNTKLEDSTQEAVILTYGYIDSYTFQDLDSGIQERIAFFNRSQNDYYIEVVKFGEDSYADGLKVLNASIAAGNGPDIMEISDEALLCQFGNKGIIENLYTYMEDGEWPQHEDFVENILRCFETEDNLYGITPFFKIFSVIGNPDYIQSNQVTFTQLKEMYEKNKDNDDITVYNSLTKSFLLWLCINPSIEKFVDMENHSCDFLNQEFQDLLEFSAQFEDNNKFNANDFEDMIRVQEGKMILYYNGVMGSFRDYTHYRELSGQNGILIGLPSIDGCSPKITTNFPFLCINSKSKYKDVAWQFLCTFLEDGYLIADDNVSLSKGFPVTKSGFESVSRKLIDSTKNVSGEGSITDAMGNTTSYPMLPTTQEDVEYIQDVISRIVPPSEDYGEIERIIGEEIASYWNGSKTVQEVMEIIQNRAQLYLGEM